MKKPAKTKASTQAKPKAARDYFPPVPPDDPIYQSGYVVGGRYPARKPSGFASQLSKTIEDVLTEVDDEAARQVLEKFQRNLTGKENPAKTPKPLTASQLAKRYGLEPTTIANLKASQAKLKAMGRDLTLEQVYVLEMDGSTEN